MFSLSSPVGPLWLASNHDALTRLGFGALPAVSLAPTDPVEEAAQSWLARYFAGERPPASLPLQPQGTPFQRSVWSLLLQIPYGHTTTYGAIAKQLGTHARAVGAAVGANPLPIVIPCHRVVGQNGTLTGYLGGLETKRYLLELEGAR